MTDNKTQMKNMLTKVLTDLENFKTGYEQDTKTISLLTTEKQKLYQRVQILLKENETLKVLAKMPLDDHAARKAARSELAKDYRKKKVRFSKNKYSSGEDEDEEIPKRKIQKKSRKKRETVEYSDSDSEDDTSSEEEEEEPTPKKMKQVIRRKSNKTAEYIKKIKITLI